MLHCILLDLIIYHFIFSSVLVFSVPPSSDGPKSHGDNPTIRHLRATLYIDDPTFLMVLSLADKIRPGAYRLIMEGSIS